MKTMAKICYLGEKQMRQENPEIKAFFNDCLQPIYTYKLLFEDLEFLNKSLESI